MWAVRVALHRGLPVVFWRSAAHMHTVSGGAAAREMESVPRVLMGEFEAVVRLGLWEIFDRDGSEVTTDETATSNILDRLVETLPDVVLL
ncbi:MAG: hypothetical protein LC775_01660, partial [Acidobacteria bacterium]|nr:hypothetical protein [Acidobacteriota bacterium]